MNYSNGGEGGATKKPLPVRLSIVTSKYAPDTLARTIVFPPLLRLGLQCAQISDPPIFREKRNEKKNELSFKRGIIGCRCPVDGEIMGEFTYNEDKTEAKVDFQAHKFPYTASVYYQCNVRLCVKHDGGCSNTVKIRILECSPSFTCLPRYLVIRYYVNKNHLLLDS